MTNSYPPESLLFLDPAPCAEFRGDSFDSTQMMLRAWRAQITNPEDVLSASIILEDVLDAEIIE